MPKGSGEEVKAAAKPEGKSSGDKGEVGGPGIDAGPSTVGKDEAAAVEKDAPAVEEKEEEPDWAGSSDSESPGDEPAPKEPPPP